MPAKVNAATMAPLQTYLTWNIFLVTNSGNKSSLFDDEISGGTTYQLTAVNLLNPNAQYTTPVSYKLADAVSDLQTWLNARSNVKFGSSFARLVTQTSVVPYRAFVIKPS